ncbi:hypothetical protein BN10_130050 [Phycicoccus elongatus Lp2]|uniref:Uncharacterized protein n=1 Tax=Phycicoccus elongatus Lp2 TaxID=1193181 RepID=N0DZY8_9MICO|nr:hypothetical protein BN10_130050 [Phycicoccus elongatus Lp2]
MLAEGGEPGVEVASQPRHLGSTGRHGILLPGQCGCPQERQEGGRSHEGDFAVEGPFVEGRIAGQGRGEHGIARHETHDELGGGLEGRPVLLARQPGHVGPERPRVIGEQVVASLLVEPVRLGVEEGHHRCLRVDHELAVAGKSDHDVGAHHRPVDGGRAHLLLEVAAREHAGQLEHPAQLHLTPRSAHGRGAQRPDQIGRGPRQLARAALDPPQCLVDRPELLRPLPLQPAHLGLHPPQRVAQRCQQGGGLLVLRQRGLQVIDPLPQQCCLGGRGGEARGIPHPRDEKADEPRAGGEDRDDRNLHAPDSGTTHRQSWSGAQQHNGQGEHHQADEGVENLPGPGAGERSRESARAEPERGEPRDRRDPGTGGKPPATGDPVLVGDVAEHEHGVEVDVRVEEGERERGGDDRSPGAARGLPAAERARVTCRPQRADPEPREVCRAEPFHARQDRRMVADQSTEACGADDDEEQVGKGTDRDDHCDVIAGQALTEDPGVLGADGDDQAEAGQQAGEQVGGEHVANGKEKATVAGETLLRLARHQQVLLAEARADLDESPGRAPLPSATATAAACSGRHCRWCGSTSRTTCRPPIWPPGVSAQAAG